MTKENKETLIEEKKGNQFNHECKSSLRPHSHLVLFSRNFPSCNAQGQSRVLDDGTGLDDVLGSLALVLGEVLAEELAQLDNLGLEAVVAGSPCLLGVEHVVGDAGAGGGDLEVEDVIVLVLDLGELARVDGVVDGAGVLEGAALATLGEAGADPAGVEQPGVGLVVLDAVRQHAGVLHGVQGQERLGEARGEGGLGLGDTVLSTGHLGGVAGDEVEHGLGAVELGDGRENTAGVAGQEDNVGGHVGRQAGDLGVLDVLDGVGAAGVLREGRVVVVDGARIGVEDDVLEDGAVADGAENIGLLLGRETDALGVAAALDVEDTAVGPAVLIVTNQGTVGVGGQGGLAGARQAEEEGDVAALALVGGRVKGQDVVLDGHLVEEDGEDSLFHFAGVLGAEDDHLLLGKVDGDRGGRGHALGVAVGGEGAGVVDGIVGVEVLELLTGRADQHVAHEEGVVGARADDADLDAVLLVPAGIAIDDVDAVAGVEVIDGTFAVDFPDLRRAIMLVAGFVDENMRIGRGFTK